MLDRRRLAALTLFAAASASLAGCDKGSPPPPHPKPAVDVVTLHAAPVTITTDLPGRLTAHRIADIRPQVSGLIIKRLFTEGDMVKAGQQLYQIDPKPYQASLDSAKATEAKARASVLSAQAQVRRYKPLAKAFAVSGQDLDNAVASLAQDQADVASGQASVETAAINLAYTRMYAPIAGRTGRSTVTEGALVTQNQTDSLVTVTELDPIYVDVTQPSSTVLRLKRESAAGDLEQTGDGATVVHLTLDDGSTYDKPGKLLFSEVNVDQSTGSVTLRAVFPNPDGLLLPGMFVREQIQEGTRKAGLLVPQRGITHNDRGDATALVIGPDGKAALRVVTLERAIGDKWLVASGLKEGDRVAVSGLQSVRPGDSPQVTEVTADGADLKPVSKPAQ
jgi:membrane fusion protein (multidrug efflux system)